MTGWECTAGLLVDMRAGGGSDGAWKWMCVCGKGGEVFVACVGV